MRKQRLKKEKQDQDQKIAASDDGEHHEEGINFCEKKFSCIKI